MLSVRSRKVKSFAGDIHALSDYLSLMTTHVLPLDDSHAHMEDLPAVFAFDEDEGDMYPLQSVPVRGLVPTQSHVSLGKLEGILEDRAMFKPVFVVIINGTMYVRNGHHRVWLNEAFGNETIVAHVADVSPAPAPSKSVKALLRDATEHFSEQYGIPIEIRSRKQSYMDNDPRPDKFVVTVPHSFDPLAENFDTDSAERYHNVFIETLAEWVEKYRHIYDNEPYEIINTKSDLKSMVKDWCDKTDTPDPKRIHIGKAETQWGAFIVSTDGSGKMSLNSFLQYVPTDLAEYVVVHEVCHARHWFELLQEYPVRQAFHIYGRDGHGKRFWNLVADNMPDYQSRKDDLTQFAKDYYNGPVPDEG